jgi:uncharacterized protein YueI
MKKIEELNQAILQQKKVLIKVAERVVENITEEDVLQPNDYLLLENDPLFRYEEGYFAGLLAAQALLKSI